ncbi:MAG: hypothetical protein NVS4B5_05340 [Vulcanimicrobiaceae bacterium]
MVLADAECIQPDAIRVDDLVDEIAEMLRRAYARSFAIVRERGETIDADLHCTRIRASRTVPSTATATAVSSTEREATTERREHQAIRHRRADRRREPGAAAVHRNNRVGIERLEVRRDLRDDGCGCGKELEASNDGMELRDT